MAPKVGQRKVAEQWVLTGGGEETGGLKRLS